MVLPSVSLDVILLLLLVVVLFLWKPASLEWLWSREYSDPVPGNVVGTALTPTSRLRVVYERLLVWLNRLVPIYYILWWLVVTVQANFDQSRRPPGTGPWSGTLFAIILATLGISGWVYFGWDESGRAGRLRERIRTAVRGRSRVLTPVGARHPFDKLRASSERSEGPLLQSGIEPPAEGNRPKRKRKSRFKRQL